MWERRRGPGQVEHEREAYPLTYYWYRGAVVVVLRCLGCTATFPGCDLRRLPRVSVFERRCAQSPVQPLVRTVGVMSFNGATDGA